MQAKFYNETFSISPFSLAFLIGLCLFIGLFVFFRHKLAQQTRQNVTVLLALVIGFTLGVAYQEYLLGQAEMLSNSNVELSISPTAGWLAGGLVGAIALFFSFRAHLSPLSRLYGAIFLAAIVGLSIGGSLDAAMLSQTEIVHQIHRVDVPYHDCPMC